MSHGLRSYCAHRGVEVRGVAGKGRGVFTLKALKPGDVVMETEAIAHHFMCAFPVCHHCLQTVERMHRCSACKFAKYCSPWCQKEDWAVHRTECKDLLALQQRLEPISPEVVLTYRALKAYVEVRTYLHGSVPRFSLRNQMPQKTKIAVKDPTGKLPYTREDIDILCSSAWYPSECGAARTHDADVECTPPEQRKSLEAAASVILEVTKADVSRDFVVALFCKARGVLCRRRLTVCRTSATPSTSLTTTCALVSHIYTNLRELCASLQLTPLCLAILDRLCIVPLFCAHQPFLLA